MLELEPEGTPPEEKERLDKELKRLKEAAGRLGEHFDTVKIFCTKQSDDGQETDKYEYGIGNFFAIYGHIKNYVLATEQAFKGDLLIEEDDEKF